MTTRSRRGGGKGQPIRPIPAEIQGDRKKSIEQQASAPLARAAGPTTPQGGAGPATPQPGAAPPHPVQRPDVFGQTQRPNEPLTAGAAIGPGKGTPSVMSRDPDMLLRAMVKRFPHPDLIALLARRHDV